jgi:hypothetical protein
MRSACQEAAEKGFNSCPKSVRARFFPKLSFAVTLSRGERNEASLRRVHKKEYWEPGNDWIKAGQFPLPPSLGKSRITRPSTPHPVARWLMGRACSRKTSSPNGNGPTSPNARPPSSISSISATCSANPNPLQPIPWRLVHLRTRRQEVRRRQRLGRRLNARPFRMGIQSRHRDLAAALAKKTRLILLNYPFRHNKLSFDRDTMTPVSSPWPTVGEGGYVDVFG